VRERERGEDQLKYVKEAFKVAKRVLSWRDMGYIYRAPLEN